MSGSKIKKFMHKKSVRDNLAGYLFIAPLLVYFLVFQMLPMFLALGFSFTDWQNRGAANFVGFQNYIRLFSNWNNMYPHFYKSFGVTLYYMVLTIPASVILCIVVSAMLNSKIKGEKFFKTAFYVPSVTAGVAIAAMWVFMLDPGFGLVNGFLNASINFLGTQKLVMPTLAFMGVWSGLGYNVLIMVSAMKNIDASLYEAAQIDGAGALIKFTKITIPSVMPTIFFIIITSMIGSFQVFDPMFLMTGKGELIGFATYSYMYHVYDLTFGSSVSHVGVATAMSYIMFVVIMIVTFVQFKILPQQMDGQKTKKKFRFKNLFQKKLKPGGGI